MGRDHSNEQIARRLGRSRETVKSQVSRVMRKLGVVSRTDAVVKAIEAGLIPARGRREIEADA